MDVCFCDQCGAGVMGKEMEMRNTTKFTIVTAGVLVVLLMVSMSAMASYMIQTEGECVKSKSGYDCSQVVSKVKQGDNNKAIFCGDSYVYGNDKTKAFVNAHVEDGHSLILTKDGKYSDGLCY